jgi:hypothetical protein
LELGGELADEVRFIERVRDWNRDRKRGGDFERRVAARMQCGELERSSGKGAVAMNGGWRNSKP